MSADDPFLVVLTTSVSFYPILSRQSPIGFLEGVGQVDILEVKSSVSKLMH